MISVVALATEVVAAVAETGADVMMLEALKSIANLAEIVMVGLIGWLLRRAHQIEVTLAGVSEKLSGHSRQIERNREELSKVSEIGVTIARLEEWMKRKP